MFGAASSFMQRGNFMKKYILAAVFTLMFTPFSHANESLAPASNTNGQSFDQSVQEQNEVSEANKDNFGHEVSAEAKELRETASEANDRAQEAKEKEDSVEQGNEVESDDQEATEVSGHERDGTTEKGEASDSKSDD